MAYVKDWAPRSFKPLRAARYRNLLAGAGPGTCTATRREVVDAIGRVDLAYLDPPYNQHRYFTNYHVWETLVAWDQPEHYGIACKRIDARDDRPRACSTASARCRQALRARSKRSTPTS